MSKDLQTSVNPFRVKVIITIPATLTYNSGEKARHMCWPETTQQLVSHTTPEIWYNLQIYVGTLSAVLSSASTSTPNHHFVRPPVQFQPRVPDGTLRFYNNTISYICLGKSPLDPVWCITMPVFHFVSPNLLQSEVIHFTLAWNTGPTSLIERKRLCCNWCAIPRGL